MKYLEWKTPHIMNTNRTVMNQVGGGLLHMSTVNKYHKYSKFNMVVEKTNKISDPARHEMQLLKMHLNESVRICEKRESLQICHATFSSRVKREYAINIYRAQCSRT